MNLNKIALLTGLVVSEITISSLVAPANASTNFSLSFFDGSTQIGSGQFTDSESPSACFPTSEDPNDCGPNGTSQVYVTHQVSSFLANISGTNITTWYPSGVFWYADPSIPQSPGSIAVSQYGPTLEPNSWIFSGNDSITNPFPQLELVFSSASATSASGSFNEDNVSGTFTATAVPEPLAILGVITGLGLLGGLKRKLSKK